MRSFLLEDAVEIMEISYLSNHWLGGIFFYTFIFYRFYGRSKTILLEKLFFLYLILIKEVYNGTIEHGHDDPAYLDYKTGITMGCWGLFVFAASSAIYACEFDKRENSFIKKRIEF